MGAALRLVSLSTIAQPGLETDTLCIDWCSAGYSSGRPNNWSPYPPVGWQTSSSQSGQFPSTAGPHCRWLSRRSPQFPLVSRCQHLRLGHLPAPPLPPPLAQHLHDGLGPHNLLLAHLLRRPLPRRPAGRCSDRRRQRQRSLLPPNPTAEMGREPPPPSVCIKRKPRCSEYKSSRHTEGLGISHCNRVNHAIGDSHLQFLRKLSP